jgi:hypothetical protein
MTLSLPLTQGCAALALGYFRRLPTGADRCAAHRMADVVIHLELLVDHEGKSQLLGGSVLTLHRNL